MSLDDVRDGEQPSQRFRAGRFTPVVLPPSDPEQPEWHISRNIRLQGDRALHASEGHFGFTITEDEVWVIIPDRFGNSAGYNFSRPDFDRIVGSFASIQTSTESLSNSGDLDR